MSDIFSEHLVKRKPKSSEQALKYGLIFLTAFLILGGLFILGPLIYPGIILGVVCYFFIFPRFNVEYEYSYVNGEFDIDVIYSMSKRKHKETFSVTNVECVAPLGSHQLDAFQHDFQVTDYSSLDPDVRPYVFVLPQERRIIYMQIEDDSLITDLKYRLPRRFFTE
ncbi:MAG: DUF6106 family protein [Lachnospiraceae bacterium]|nr:DUF6106 family protein [Lachnospiraceae bacterium]